MFSSSSSSSGKQGSVQAQQCAVVVVVVVSLKFNLIFLGVRTNMTMSARLVVVIKQDKRRFSSAMPALLGRPGRLVDFNSLILSCVRSV